MTRRVLVIGPSSGLASEFVRNAPPSWWFGGVGRTAGPAFANRSEALHLLDARDLGTLEFAVRANDCDTVVSFLQEGDRRTCQSERPLPSAVPAGLAWDVNVLATEAVCRAAVSEHKRVVVVSTDEVFAEGGGPVDESVEGVPWPENPSWYGGTWAEAEARLARIPGSIAVLRVSALFGWSSDRDCEARLAGELGRAGPGVPAQLQPTFVPDAVRALVRLVEDPLSGRFHASLSAPVERKELAARLAAHAGSIEPLPDSVPERHPGLVPGRLPQIGLPLSTPTAALEWLGRRPRD